MNSLLDCKPSILVLARHPAGGIRTYLRYVYSQPSLGGVKKTLMIPFDNNIEFYNKAFDDVIVGKQSSSINKYWLSILINLLKSRPDIVHSHGLTTGIVLSPLLRLMRIKHVVTLHDVFDIGHFNGLKGSIKKLIVKVAFKLINIINPCGRDVGLNINEFFPTISKSKIKVIQNGINVAQFSSNEKRDLKLELAIDNDALLLGFFGRFMRQKGFDILRDAVLQLNESGKKYYVACFGWGGFIREEQAELERLNIASQFHFLPHTDNVGEAMRGLDIVIIPSRWEACPLLPMEAFVAGLPIIASDCIGLRDVCEDTPSLNFKSGSSNDLASAIEIFKDEQLKIMEEITAFKSIAFKRFDVLETSKSLKHIYDNLL